MFGNWKIREKNLDFAKMESDEHRWGLKDLEWNCNEILGASEFFNNLNNS